jgi:hypothetical protein
MSYGRPCTDLCAISIDPYSLFDLILASSSRGVIRIGADVLLVDASGKTVAQSKVGAHFGSTGDVGLTTNILNVEEDFERAAVALIR